MEKTNKRKDLLVFLRAQLSAQVATLADFVLTYICFQWLGIYYVIATTVGLITGGILNCFINYKWAFKSQGCRPEWVAFKYILVWAGSFALNVKGLYLLVEFVKNHTLWWNQADGLSLIVCKIIVSLIVSVGWNYTFHRHFVFRNLDFKMRTKNLFHKKVQNEYQKFL